MNNEIRETDLAMGEEPGPLSDGDKEALVKAAERARKILRAGRIATFNGWTLGFCALLSLLIGLTSVTGLVVTVCLAIIARNEFRGRDQLRRFELDGPRLLGRNQVALMSLVVVYCLWSIFHTVSNPSEEMAQLEELIGLPGNFVSNLTLTVYGVAIVLTLVFQGWNARYYFSRVQLLTDYLEETPEWIVDLQKTGLDLPG